MDEMHLFGEIAIAKGYVTAPQVRRALAIQGEMHRSGAGHKLIGVLLVELGYLTTEQVVDVLAASDAEPPPPFRVGLAEPPERPDPLLEAG
ncbi:MAG TPA: hypothetical protein VHF22_04075 [Planctomycetota bacterium]|nr:hypothetical protein [Planctomycetota bacterium]